MPQNVVCSIVSLHNAWILRCSFRQYWAMQEPRGVERVIDSTLFLCLNVNELLLFNY